MKQTLTLVAAALSLVLSVFTLASVRSLPAPPGTPPETRPTAPPVPATGPAVLPGILPSSAECDELRRKMADLESRLATRQDRASTAPAGSGPAHPDREAMLEEMERMWKARKEGGGGPAGAGLAQPLDLGKDGPGVGPELTRTLDLRPLQVQALNETLQRAYREYSALEEPHAKTTRNADGSVHVAVQAFPEEGRAFRERLQSQMDSLLDLRQRELIRMHLQPALDRLFLNFGNSDVRIDLAKSEGLFECRETGKNSVLAHSGPDLPIPYRRFWKE